MHETRRPSRAITAALIKGTSMKWVLQSKRQKDTQERKINSESLQ